MESFDDGVDLATDLWKRITELYTQLERSYLSDCLYGQSSSIDTRRFAEHTLEFCLSLKSILVHQIDHRRAQLSASSARALEPLTGRVLLLAKAESRFCAQVSAEHTKHDLSRCLDVEHVRPYLSGLYMLLELTAVANSCSSYIESHSLNSPVKEILEAVKNEIFNFLYSEQVFD